MYTNDAAKAQEKKRLAAIFQETKRVANAYGKVLDRKTADEMIKNTLAYHTRKNGHLLKLNTRQDIPTPSAIQPAVPVDTVYQVLPVDCCTAAKQMVGKGLKPLMLNMANKNSVGGGVEMGSAAQEEDIFRCSNIFQALYPQGKLEAHGAHAGRTKYHYPIQEFGCYYTPHVQIFRDRTQNYNFIKPFEVSVISVAGYDLGKLHHIEKNLQGLKGPALLERFSFFTEIKIRHILEVALLHKHDSLVLGAISCGAFTLKGFEKETTEAVAKAFKKVLEEVRYKKRFKNISFAILPLGPRGKENLETFEQMVRGLPQAHVPLNPVLQFRAAPLRPARLPYDTDLKDAAEDELLMNQLDENTKVLFNIIKRDLNFFENLPAGIDRKKSETAIEQAILDHLLSGQYNRQSFELEFGRDGKNIRVLFDNTLSVALDMQKNRTNIQHRL